MRIGTRSTLLTLAILTPLIYSPQSFSSSDFENQVSNNTAFAPRNGPSSPHKLFMTADSSAGDEFDVWQMDTGYAYSVIDGIDLYVATRISNSSDNTPSRGFLSGANYYYNKKLSLNSAIYVTPDSTDNSVNESISAELSGKYMLTESLNLKATLDLEEWQRGIEVKLGFSF